MLCHRVSRSWFSDSLWSIWFILSRKSLNNDFEILTFFKVSWPRFTIFNLDLWAKIFGFAIIELFSLYFYQIYNLINFKRFPPRPIRPNLAVLGWLIWVGPVPAGADLGRAGADLSRYDKAGQAVFWNFFKIYQIIYFIRIMTFDFLNFFEKLRI